MNAFSALVDNLYYLNSNNAKTELVLEYLRNTPDPDRGWAIGAIAGTLSFEFFKRKTIKDIILERIDPVLFELSYDYVGEMSETVAHLWSTTTSKRDDSITLPTLSEVVEQFSSLPKSQIKPYLISLLDIMTPTQRWALLKLGTKGLRIGVSARFLKKILALYGSQHNPSINIEQIERVWHGVSPPYINMLAWLEAKSDMPDISNQLTFQPVMLAHPIDADILPTISPEHWQAEWKFDGIRAQLVSNHTGTALFSRNGDDISHSFPDLITAIEKADINGRFDGELVALHSHSDNALTTSNKSADESKVGASQCHQTSIAHNNFDNIASFNQLQQRLNKKKPSKALMQSIPVALIVYDALQLNQQDIRETPLHQRSAKIQTWLVSLQQPLPLYSSTLLPFKNDKDLISLKEKASQLSNGYIEGIMLKRKDAVYVAGRPKGQWYKLKRDPKLIDAVIMYAQRGHGKRSSFYSDFTFGCWQDGVLLPIGKAYSGFTDSELKELDTWVRRNTMGRFGPVKEVKKELVFEIAFDAVQNSNRHKSKVALRFPRIHRIRWDKPAAQADELSTLVKMIG